MSKKANAFTIVELLIVIVVIAILAAISIVAYRGIQDRANSSAASAKLSQAVKKIQLYYAEKDEYPSTGDFAAADITDTTGLAYKANNTVNPKTYCMTATVNGKSYYMNNTTVTSPTPGGCPGHGQNGAEPITNLAAYPNFTGTGAIANGWLLYSHDGGNTMTRSVSGGQQTLTATSLISGFRRAGVRHANISFGGTVNPNTKYLSARVNLDTSGLATGTRVRLYIDIYNGGTVVASPGVTTTTVSGSTQLVFSPMLISMTATQVIPYIWIETTSGGNWTGTSIIKLSQFALYLSDTAVAPAYYDGNSPNWDWNGTPDASTSSGPAS